MYHESTRRLATVGRGPPPYGKGFSYTRPDILPSVSNKSRGLRLGWVPNRSTLEHVNFVIRALKLEM